MAEPPICTEVWYPRGQADRPFFPQQNKEKENGHACAPLSRFAMTQLGLAYRGMLTHTKKKSIKNGAQNVNKL